MPNRIIRDGILSSESVDALSFAEEVFYRRLQSVADDHGRFYANPKLIRAACYPLRLDRVSDDDIVSWAKACQAAGLVDVYVGTDEKKYIQIIKFGQRIQAKSKFPDPSTDVIHRDSPLPTVENRLVGVEDVVGDGVEDEGDIPPTAVGGEDAPPFGKQQPIVDAYNRILRTGRGNPCEKASTPTDKLKRRLKQAEKVARAVCKQQGWQYDPATFWTGYFTVCDGDPWMRGDVPNKNNSKWRQNLAVLLDDKRLETVINQAIESMRANDESV